MRGKILLRITGASLLLVACYFAIRDIFEYFQINDAAANFSIATILGAYVSLIGCGVFIYVALGFLVFLLSVLKSPTGTCRVRSG